MVFIALYFIPVSDNYRWQPLRDFLAKRSLTDIESVNDNSYQRRFSIAGEPADIKATYNPNKNGFDVDISVSTSAHTDSAITKLIRVLDCDANWQTIEPALREAGIDVTDDIRGLRIPGVWDTFEAGCRAILGQQVSVAGAISKTKQLVHAIREVHRGYGFPSPEQFSQEIIASLGMPESRKQTLLRFSEYMCNTENVKQVENGNIDGLLAIKGIGPWTCQYILMRATYNRDVWMEKDLAVIRQCDKHALIADAAKPWRSYLTMALWHTY